MTQGYTFICPLPNGLHARPASHLAEVAGRFGCQITLTNQRSGAQANAKSVLALVGTDVKLGDPCQLDATGDDADAAMASLRQFIEQVLPGCDEPLPAPQANGQTVTLPRVLRNASASFIPGTAVSPGIGEGSVVIVGGLCLPQDLPEEATTDRAGEQAKASQAIRDVRSAIESKLTQRLSHTEAGVLKAHLSIVSDVLLHEKIAALVAEGQSAARAVAEAGEFFMNRLRAAQSLYLRERAIDVQDLCLQLLERICGQRFKTAPVQLTVPSVVVAENLAPGQFLALDRSLLKALVLAHGGATSHTVILARSFDIPTLIGVRDAPLVFSPGQPVIVDANLGIVIASPAEAVRRYYRRELATLSRHRERFARHLPQPAITTDGQHLEVAANVATAEELSPAFDHGAEGIGVFRTEMLFMDRDSAPSEQEQFDVYARAAQAAAGRPVIIRSIDIGGDKPVPYLNLPPEPNPFLGCRGVRLYMEHQDVFTAQLRAILRASALGDIRLMVPMVSCLEEVRWVKARVTECQATLKAEGLAYNPAMPLGIMVEVPAVAFAIDAFCAEVDFFSIGTNDLTQYFLAADRDNPKVGGLYTWRHPAFLRFLARLVHDAHAGGKWVGLCGEMARDAQALPLLVAMGLDEIGVPTPDILPLKAAIAQGSAGNCRTLLSQALACRTAGEVNAILQQARAGAARQGLLERGAVLIDSDCANKEEAIACLIDAFYVAARTEDRRRVEEAVWAREAVYSTGLGHGFAIPHCKSDAMVANSIGILRLKRPIEWGSIDNQPVRMVILLATRESDKDQAHMRVFSKLARKLMHEDFREHLLHASNEELILKFLSTEVDIVHR